MAQLTPTTPEEYRKGKTKLVELATGHVFEIRKMPVQTFSIMFETLGIDVPPGMPIENVEKLLAEEMKDPQYKTKIVETITKILPHCIVKPKVTANPSEGALSIDDIEPADMFALFGEIMEFSGISQMAKDLRDKFRV
jgi:hypothetical protein